jgi:hypothetical protein
MPSVAQDWIQNLDGFGGYNIVIAIGWTSCDWLVLAMILVGGRSLPD